MFGRRHGTRGKHGEDRSAVPGPGVWNAGTAPRRPFHRSKLLGSGTPERRGEDGPIVPGPEPACVRKARIPSMSTPNPPWRGGNPTPGLGGSLFECWSEGKGPSYFPRTTPLKPATVDRGAIQWAQY